MRLVHHHDAVLGEQRVIHELAEQHAVRAELDLRDAGRAHVLEPHRVPDLGDRGGCPSPRRRARRSSARRPFAAECTQPCARRRTSPPRRGTEAPAWSCRIPSGPRAPSSPASPPGTRSRRGTGRWANAALRGEREAVVAVVRPAGAPLAAPRSTSSAPQDARGARGAGLPERHRRTARLEARAPRTNARATGGGRNARERFRRGRFHVREDDLCLGRRGIRKSDGRRLAENTRARRRY